MDDIQIGRFESRKKLWMPTNPCYKDTTEFINSKATSAAVPILHTSEDIRCRDVITNCGMTKKELHLLEKKHVNKLEKAKLKREELNKQWLDLKQRETKFRNEFTFFERFLKKNEVKRTRASKNIAEMGKLIEKRSNDIAVLKEELEDAKSVKADMDENINKLTIYQDYLNSVKNNYPHLFNSVQDIIRRYSSLLEVRRNVGDFYERGCNELLDSRKDSIKLTEEKRFIIMGLNNQLANLQARFESATIRALDGEQLVVQIKNSAVKQINEIDEAKAAIWNIYQQMTISKKHLSIKIKKEDVEQQIMYIKRTLSELARVNQMIKGKSKSTYKVRDKRL